MTPIPYVPTTRVSGLRLVARVPNGDHELAYYAESATQDVLRIEYATRIVRGRPVRCLVGAKMVERARGTA